MFLTRSSPHFPVHDWSDYDTEVNLGQVFKFIMTYPRGAQRTMKI